MISKSVRLLPLQNQSHQQQLEQQPDLPLSCLSLFLFPIMFRRRKKNRVVAAKQKVKQEETSSATPNAANAATPAVATTPVAIPPKAITPKAPPHNKAIDHKANTPSIATKGGNDSSSSNIDDVTNIALTA